MVFFNFKFISSVPFHAGIVQLRLYRAFFIYLNIFYLVSLWLVVNKQIESQNKALIFLEITECGQYIVAFYHTERKLG